METIAKILSEFCVYIAGALCPIILAKYEFITLNKNTRLTMPLLIWLLCFSLMLLFKIISFTGG